MIPNEDTKRAIYDSLLVPIKTNGKEEQLKEPSDTFNDLFLI